ncbi:hypothetical protein [Streptacidiphilus cavernicola]|uniref:Uncharacterized protein n=1 Tax=Streptacidiphilus cavernicola TaxID=3342716 RepID=A0ABV6VY62_9ACTN
MIGTILQIPPGCEWSQLPDSDERVYTFAHLGGWVATDRRGLVLGTAHGALAQLHQCVTRTLSYADLSHVLTTLTDEATMQP